MSFTDWLTNTRESVKERGLSGLADSFYQFYVGTWRRVGRIYNYGEPIYEREWDVLIVLDACRADLMTEVADDYEFVDDNATTSVASTSGEWMEKNFHDPAYRNEVRKTAYVTGNPFSDKEFFRHECRECGSGMDRFATVCRECNSENSPRRVADHDFQILDEVWQYGWDDDLGTIPPDPLTDRAIATWRDESPGRMVVHYMQPHHPFVSSEIQTDLDPESFGDAGQESVWDRVRRGEVDRFTVWEDYRSNLKYVLDDVERLLKNVDANRVVITADHGNSIGEWGLYGHYRAIPLDSQKSVPWCVTTAENTADYTPDVDRSVQAVEADVEDRLEALGYR